MNLRIANIFRDVVRWPGFAAICLTLTAFLAQATLSHAGELSGEKYATTITISDTTKGKDAAQADTPKKRDKASPVPKGVTTKSAMDTTSAGMQGATSTRGTAELYNSGLQHLESGDAQTAAATFSDVLKQEPNHYNAMVNLARADIDLGNYEEAQTMIDQALQANPNDADAHMVRGRLMQSMDNNEEAITSYKKSIELQDENPYAYNNLALIYIQNGQFNEAVPLLEKAVQQKKDIVFFHNNLGIAYEGMQNYGEAQAAYQAALAVDPNYDKAKANLERIEAELASTSAAPSGQDTTKHLKGMKETAPAETPVEKPEKSAGQDSINKVKPKPDTQEVPDTIEF